MSSSIENRAPLLDYRLVEYMMSISKIKKNKNGIKSIYKKIVRNILPDNIVKAKKSGPTLPIALWLKEDKNFKNQMIKYIKDNILYIEQLLSKDLANSILKDEINSTDNNFLIRFRVFCLIIWFKIKIEQSIKDPTISLEKVFKNN